MEFDGKDWVNEREVPFNSDEFDNAHPAVSPDDKFLYFVSNRPGGYGGTDLWRVERRANRTYGSPSNLGPRVNTFGDERYPFVSKDNILYFASDGHSGFGGLDLFRAEYLNGIWGNTQNMMRPFNSDKDDFGYVINPTDPQKGLLSTNRQGDGTEDVIFYVQYLDEEESEEPAAEEPAADIIRAEPETEMVPVTRPEPVVVAEPVPDPVQEPEPVEEEPKVDLSIFPSALNSMLISSFNGNPLSGATVILSDAFTGTVINRGTTGENGRFSLAIPDAYRLEGQEFEITVSKNEFNTRKVVGNIMELEEIGSAGFSLTPIFEETDLNEISDLSIPYEGQNITTEGFSLLDQVAAYLLSNPNVVIKLNGHTDARGNRMTNLTTSQTVAEKAEAYLLSKGVPDDNLIPRGYGERYLQNNCRRGKLCSEAEHMNNRRIEVVVWRFLQ
ncbi:OmpA family protein [Geofilum rubicundum]|uniref:OmpA family protein n=1 Tax=Geofilum rubicundum TaxID=472113 RepID=UPI001D0F23F5|nr:OmpA family protein [Geofilum rubicundum]